MKWGVLTLVVLVLTLVWGGAFVGYRWSRKRLGLDTPDQACMGEREKRARRSLRALLAFNFFVMWPLGLPTCVMMTAFAFEARELGGFSIGALFGLCAFTVAVPSLIGTVKRLEEQRLSGPPDGVPPSIWIDGESALVSRLVAGGARSTDYAIAGAVLIVAVLNWELMVASLLWLATLAAIRFAWKMMARRP